MLTHLWQFLTPTEQFPVLPQLEILQKNVAAIVQRLESIENPVAMGSIKCHYMMPEEGEQL